MLTTNAFLITIGTELLIGKTIDTNSVWVGQELNKIGIWLSRKMTVPDNYDDIINALQYAQTQSNIVLVTGGLGPTSDDITKETVATFFNNEVMKLDENSLKRIELYFRKRGKKMLDIHKQQAYLPSNCRAIANFVGTAPGMWFNEKNCQFIVMPGVPSEMQYMMSHEILPALAQQSDTQIIHRYLMTIGEGESGVASRLVDFEKQLPKCISLAYLPNKYALQLRLTAQCKKNDKTNEQLLNKLHQELIHQLGDILVGDDDSNLPTILGKKLKTYHATVSTAESCTGGYLSHLITSIAGSSAYYMGSLIAYDNDVKCTHLGVDSSILNNFGAVSQQTAEAMVHGCIRKFDTDYAVALSGIMGPSGSLDSNRPVGVVYISVASKTRINTIKRIFCNDRMGNISQAAYTALIMLLGFVDDENFF